MAGPADDDIEHLKNEHQRLVQKYLDVRNQTNDKDQIKRASDAADAAGQAYQRAYSKKQAQTPQPNTAAAGALLKMFGGK